MALNTGEYPVPNAASCLTIIDVDNTVPTGKDLVSHAVESLAINKEEKSINL